MKKIFSMFLVPLLAIMLFCGCGKDKSIEDVQKAYKSMISSFVVEDNKNMFFSSETNPNAIIISYPTGVQEVIDNEFPSTELQRRYRALYYQQKILDEIFGYYNTYQEDFYRVVKSKGNDVDQDLINNLYDSVNYLRDALKAFEGHYNTFVSINEKGMSDVMTFNLTSYSFQLNKVIDASFDFIKQFKNVYLDHCISDYSVYNKSNLDSYVNVAYLDMSYIIYLENIKSFDDSVGGNGVCDLAGVVGSNSKYNLLDNLNTRKTISLSITENVGSDTEMGRDATEFVKAFIYSRDVFNQRLSTYFSTYYELDMYKINQYKYNTSGVIDFDSYLMSLSASDRATVSSLDNFVQNVFANYLEKLNSIVQ